MPKKLVVACDGTWGEADRAAAEGKPIPTNVTKFARAIAQKDDHLVYYGPGLGTRPFERLRGGFFGYGMSREVKAAYRFVAETYEPGDQLYFVGYSRGATCARSCVGFIRNSGILRTRHLDRVDEAYDLYRNRKVHPRDVAAELFRRTYSHETNISFLGVWDTVGALGIPLSGGRVTRWINDRWAFHDLQLSKIVEAAFQALAIDERRKTFEAAIWQQDPAAVNQRVEQVWFAGVHGDVGGGGFDTRLSDLALRWMVQEAMDCGLEFQPDTLTVGVDTVFGVPFTPDALKKQLARSPTGWYKYLPAWDRPIGKQENGCESLASTAHERYQKDSGYRPPRLVEYVKGDHRTTDV